MRMTAMVVVVVVVVVVMMMTMMTTTTMKTTSALVFHLCEDAVDGEDGGLLDQRGQVSPDKPRRHRSPS
jgi:hypothetical protein